MNEPTEASWVVVVPVKRADVAKTRLGGVTATQRAALARAFPADCVQAALACTRVRRVVAVTDDERAAAVLRDLGGHVIPDEPDAGLNPALEHAVTHVREQYGDTPVAVLSGDLPALRPAELSAALDRAGAHPRAFVPDRGGHGTTLLAAAAGVRLDARFGPRSRDQHAGSGARELQTEGLDSVRHDVDTSDDLREAVRLGVGAHTRRVLDELGIAP
jgi:2-phospho-L-lactate/phosphoenolpyruvate guanylyltransferase